MISVIVPTYNEAECIEQTLKKLLALNCSSGHEVIVADGGSDDRTVEIAERYVPVLRTEKGKAKQMNAGAKAAKGMILFFAHADMSFAKGTLQAICDAIKLEGFDGGGFANVFDQHNERIKRLGRIMNLRFSNKEQSDRHIFYGDNGIFVRKAAFEELGGFDEIPIMEDHNFSVKMKSLFRVKLIKDPPLVLSARRHIEAGFIKTRLQWILIKRLYLMGVSSERLDRWYKDVRGV